MAFEAFTITGEKLGCVRGGRRVFSGLDFVAAPGALVELRGRNGAGKSTLLRLIAGFIAPSEGQLVVARGGVTFDDDAAPLSMFLSLLGHMDGLKAVMTPVETLFFAANFGGAIATPAHALERLGLSRLAETPIQYFSAGQRRRLALARIYMTQRPIWLLDEPLSALDDDGRARVRDIISEHLGRGGTVIAATHEEIAAGANRVAMPGARAGLTQNRVAVP